MLQPNIDMTSPQGLDKNKEYEAQVVQNNDKEKHKDRRMLGRIQIRIPELFEGIPDEHLPWAIPSHTGPDGTSSDFGAFSSPKIGSKVLVRFQNGSAQHPVYRGGVTDEKSILKEAEENYPDRKVTKLKNGCLVIVDTKTNDVFIRNPGTANIYILGDVNLTVKGNLTEEIKGNKTLNISGNYIEKVGGSHKVSISGSEDGSVGGHRNWSIGGFDTSS